MLKTTTIITLLFFCWSFLPLWQAVAWAAEKGTPSAVGNQHSAKAKVADSRKLSADSAGKFEKALESIREGQTKGTLCLK